MNVSKEIYSIFVAILIQFGVSAQTVEKIRLSSFEDSLSFALGIETALDLYRTNPLFEILSKQHLVRGFQSDPRELNMDECQAIIDRFLGAQQQSLDTHYLESGSECIGLSMANFFFGRMAIQHQLDRIKWEFVHQGFKQGVYQTYEPNLSNVGKRKVVRKFEELVEEAQNAQVAHDDSIFWENVLQIEGVKQVGETGIYIETLKEGKGGNPTDSSDIEAEYIYMNTRGDTLQSTFEMGQSTKLNLTMVIDGWREGFSVMQKGGVYRLYIPFEKAYKNASNKNLPKGALCYYIELIDFGPRGSIFKQPPPIKRIEH